MAEGSLNENHMSKVLKDVINLSKNLKHNANKLMNTEDDFYI